MGSWRASKSSRKQQGATARLVRPDLGRGLAECNGERGGESGRKERERETLHWGEKTGPRVCASPAQRTLKHDLHGRATTRAHELAKTNSTNIPQTGRPRALAPGPPQQPWKHTAAPPPRPARTARRRWALRDARSSLCEACRPSASSVCGASSESTANVHHDHAPTFFTPPWPETPRKRTSTGYRLGGGFAGFQHFRGHVRASGNHELLLNGWRRSEVMHDCQGATSYKLYTSKE